MGVVGTILLPIDQVLTGWSIDVCLMNEPASRRIWHIFRPPRWKENTRMLATFHNRGFALNDESEQDAVLVSKPVE